MTAPRASLHRRSQEGVTLIETLAVLAISSIIMIPLLGWAMLAIQEQESALNRNIDGASIGLLRTYFVRDVASAKGAATGAAAQGTDCSGGAGAATAPAQTLLRLERNAGESVVYNEVTSSGGVGLSIWRRECDGTTLTATTEVVDRVAPGGTAATCSARAGAPETDCGRVNFRLVTVEADTVSMTATVRTGEQDGGGAGGPVYVSPDVIIQVSPTTVFRGDTVTFDASGSSDPNGGALSHHWDFDDGTTSTDAVATRSYDTLGEFTALYTATNSDGTPASEFIRITVENEPPTAVISAPSNGFSTTRCADVSMAAAGSNDSGDAAYGGSVVEYRWSYGDGETSTRTSPAAHNHQFRTLGPSGGTVPLDVGLVVIDNEDGGSLAAIRPVLVQNRPPSIPSITADGATGTVPADPTIPVEFAGTVSDPDICATSGEVLTYEWDFGDGETSSCTGPFCGEIDHTYTTVGTFTAVLTVVDTGGASVISNEIIVDLETSSGVASFTMAPSTARAGVPLPAGWITNTSADPASTPDCSLDLPERHTLHVQQLESSFGHLHPQRRRRRHVHLGRLQGRTHRHRLEWRSPCRQSEDHGHGCAGSRQSPYDRQRLSEPRVLR